MEEQSHRKSACFLQLLVFLKTWVIAPFCHWRFQVFHKGCCHDDLKVFCETWYNSVLQNIKENIKSRWLVYYLSLLFWSAFSRIRTEYGEILHIFQYSVRMWEKTPKKPEKTPYLDTFHAVNYVQMYYVITLNKSTIAMTL